MNKNLYLTFAVFIIFFSSVHAEDYNEVPIKFVECNSTSFICSEDGCISGIFGTFNCKVWMNTTNASIKYEDCFVHAVVNGNIKANVGYDGRVISSNQNHNPGFGLLSSRDNHIHVDENTGKLEGILDGFAYDVYPGALPNPFVRIYFEGAFSHKLGIADCPSRNIESSVVLKTDKKWIQNVRIKEDTYEELIALKGADEEYYTITPYDDLSCNFSIQGIPGKRFLGKNAEFRLADNEGNLIASKSVKLTNRNINGGKVNVESIFNYKKDGATASIKSKGWTRGSVINCSAEVNLGENRIGNQSRNIVIAKFVFNIYSQQGAVNVWDAHVQVWGYVEKSLVNNDTAHFLKSVYYNYSVIDNAKDLALTPGGASVRVPGFDRAFDRVIVYSDSAITLNCGGNRIACVSYVNYAFIFTSGIANTYALTHEMGHTMGAINKYLDDEYGPYILYKKRKTALGAALVNNYPNCQVDYPEPCSDKGGICLTKTQYFELPQKYWQTYIYVGYGKNYNCAESAVSEWGQSCYVTANSFRENLGNNCYPITTRLIGLKTVTWKGQQYLIPYINISGAGTPLKGDNYADIRPDGKLNNDNNNFRSVMGVSGFNKNYQADYSICPLTTLEGC
jgi:hypothetical protein